MLTQRFTPRSVARGRRRTTDWDQGPFANGLGFAADTSTIWTTGLTLTAEVTLCRIRGNVTYFLSSATAAGDGWRVATGIGITTGDAFAAGAVPDPIVDVGWDGWIWHKFNHVFAPVGFAAGAGPILHSVEIDSKAMRKVNATDVIFAVTEADELVDGSGLAVYGATRLLAMMP